MIESQIGLLASVQSWLKAETNVESAVLFGSAVCTRSDAEVTESWSDLDIHVLATDPDRMNTVDWEKVVRPQKFLIQSLRPASGGVHKLTVLLSEGQLDLVLVTAATMSSVQVAMSKGLHRELGPLREALNEMATCLVNGYRFLKGEEKWGTLYGRVAAEMAGVRLDDSSLRASAGVFLCDLFWILQKLERGELVAAQHLLHRSLSEINLRFLRELRLRKGLPLPSFGLGRHAETLLDNSDLGVVGVNARLEKTELREAAWQAFSGLKKLMEQLEPKWRVPEGVDRRLAFFR